MKTLVENTRDVQRGGLQRLRIRHARRNPAIYQYPSMDLGGADMFRDSEERIESDRTLCTAIAPVPESQGRICDPVPGPHRRCSAEGRLGSLGT